MHEQVGGKQGASSRELANLTVENYENPNKDDRQVAIDVGPSKLVSYTGATNLPAQGGWTGELNTHVAQMIAHYLKETWLDNDIGLHVHPGKIASFPPIQGYDITLKRYVKDQQLKNTIRIEARRLEMFGRYVTGFTAWMDLCTARMKEVTGEDDLEVHDAHVLRQREESDGGSRFGHHRDNHDNPGSVQHGGKSLLRYSMSTILTEVQPHVAQSSMTVLEPTPFPSLEYPRVAGGYVIFRSQDKHTSNPPRKEQGMLLKLVFFFKKRRDAHPTGGYGDHLNCPSTMACPQSHLLAKSCLPTNLVSRLREFAQVVVSEKLITQAHDMCICGPMGNTPRAEVLLNTKIAVQYSRCRRDKTAEYHDPEVRCCALCERRKGVKERRHERRQGRRPEAEQLYGHVPPAGEVGKHFVCPSCGIVYTRRWAYETGTGRSSVGRNPEQFRVLPFTADMHEMADTWEEQTGQQYNNVVLITYCGSSMCASCACGLSHGSVECGSVLGMHQDNAQKGGAHNSQAAQSVNRTLNVGHARNLRMALVRHLGGNCSNEVKDSEVNFEMHDGSEFVLNTRDEVEENRETSAGRFRCSWEHGMAQPIGPKNISCGFVGRHVCKQREVELCSDVVMNEWYDTWIHMKRCREYQEAQSAWQGMSREYASKVGPRVRAALLRWPKPRTTHRGRSSVNSMSEQLYV